MARGARRSKRQRGDVVDLSDDDDVKESGAKLLKVEEEKNQLGQEKRQLEEEKGRLEEDKRQLEEEKRQLEEEKRQLEGEKGQLEEEKGMLEIERDQAKNILKEQQSLVQCPVCLMLPREDKPVPCCPQGHFVCSNCKDKLIRQQGSLYLLLKITEPFLYNKLAHIP